MDDDCANYKTIPCRNQFGAVKLMHSVHIAGLRLADNEMTTIMPKVTSLKEVKHIFMLKCGGIV